ncbi:MAG: hypothetical protein DRN15_09610 [Thermoprotei archaeon]|nr:MAG: hypothetical protein DRM97_06550 [Thermoprotei archaeon]RLF22228.1 MAG: hypothetical protein DRN15_09610 [Thermoprotei archaeon]
MLEVYARDIGPIAEISLRIPRVCLIYGPIASGKSYLLRLMNLVVLAHELSIVRGEKEEDVLCRALVKELALPKELSSIDTARLRELMTKLILRRGARRGELVMKGDKFEVRLDVSKALDLQVEGDLPIMIYVPQERAAGELIMSETRRYIERVMRFVEQGFEASIAIRLMLAGMVGEKDLLMANYIASLAGAISVLGGDIPKHKEEVRGAYDRALEVSYDLERGLILIKDHEVQYPIAAKMTTPLGALEAANILTLVNGAVKFSEETGRNS